MGTAAKSGGLYYLNGRAVDANGRPIADAPPPPTSTVVAPVATKTLAQEIADGVVAGMAAAQATATTPAAPPAEEDVVKGKK